MRIKKLFLKKCERGIGLVEVIFALGVSVLVITSLVSLSLFTLRSALQSKLMLRGTKLATQEIENVRAFRDTMVEDPTYTWDDFIDAIRSCNPSSTQCHVDPNIGNLTINSTRRSITVDNQTVYIYFYATNTDGSSIAGGAYPDVVKISVTAHWRLSNQDKYVHNYTNLSNWRGD